MKPWAKPELIVLVRSNPEEAVLTACKNLPEFTGGPSVSSGDFRCNAGGPTGQCSKCSTWGAS
jgi:hypothetical protein